MINPTVSFVRVFSMLLILVTHYLSWKNINDFQLSTVGVSAFLFISGYLYGKKDINNKTSFFYQRVKRVLIPFWILSTFLSVYLLIQQEYMVALCNFFETLFNLQGLHSIIRIPFKLGNYHISGLAHCWFLTVIMLCYVFIVLIKKTKVEHLADNHPALCLFFLTVLHFFLSFANIAIGTFVIFFVGYFFNRIELRKNLLGPKCKVAIIALSLLAIFLRVVLRRYIDDSQIYNFFVAPFASNMCAVCFFVIVHQICEWKSNIANTIAHSSSWGG